MPEIDPLTAPWTPELAASWHVPDSWTLEPTAADSEITWATDFTHHEPDPLVPTEPLPVPEAGPSVGFPATESPFEPEPEIDGKTEAFTENVHLPIVPETNPILMPDTALAPASPDTAAGLVPTPRATPEATEPTNTEHPALSLGPADADADQGHTVDLDAVRTGIEDGIHAADEIAASVALTADKVALNNLGVPPAWAANLQPGDRFMSVVQMLAELPDLDIAEDVPVIAVVGPSDVVELEAARTALDLPHEGKPRPVVSVPYDVGPARLEAMDLGAATRPVVVSVPVDGVGADDAERVREVLANVQAEAVIAVLYGHMSLDDNRRWVDDLGQVDAVALDGALGSAEPAGVLRLGLPVVRVDGISVDRIGWAAILCTQLAVGGATS